MKKIFLLLILFLISKFFITTEVKAEYWIHVNAKSTGQYTVYVEIETNIPGSIILSANLALKGQKSQDTFIGTQFIRVPVTEGRAKVTIDGSEGTFPLRSKLPAGIYEVEVQFYNNWTENKVAAKAANISSKIYGKDIVKLSASGQASDISSSIEKKRMWVRENFYMNYPWNPEFWRNKFGELQQVEYLGSGNPNILKMYYTKSIDVTLLVNDLKKEISIYRIGLAHE